MYKHLPNTRFDVILIDPPWHYYGSSTKDGAAGKHYKLLNDAALAQLPVVDLLHAPGVVFLWATGPRLDAAINLLHEWGLHYRGVAFVWVKTRKDGKIINGQGVRPSIVKPTTEFVLAGSLAKKGRPLLMMDESVGQVVCAPRQAHSQKPEEVQARITKLFPLDDKLELFARRRTDGWTCWGDALD